MKDLQERIKTLLPEGDLVQTIPGMESFAKMSSSVRESMTDEDLKNIFGEHGTITSALIMRDSDGKLKCFGFVNFENADDAAKAVEALNGKKFDKKEWACVWEDNE
ncbi:hypothetical protein K1719_001118 [Acacia pycnantha]|nr:hypothetical protein K1719_001118 [Acacia pycnantha]